MKTRILRAFFILLFSTTLNLPLVSESSPKGIELCQKVFDFLKEEHFQPKTQSLLNSGSNNFPYNIYLEFSSEQESLSNFLVVFEMDCILSKKNLIRQYLDFIQDSQYDCNTTVLFAYGENQKLEGGIQLYGTELFIDNFYTNENYTAIYIELEEEKNQIVVNSGRNISPGNLIRESYNAFIKNKLPIKHDLAYLSQLYFVADAEERNLQTFFENGIPAIKLSFDKNTDQENVLNVLEQISTQVFENDYWDNWEQHFILVNLFSQYRILNEKTILIFFIFIIALILIFIFVFGYINSFIKAVAWKNIRFIWYAAPLTALLVYLGFRIGRVLFFNFSLKTDYSKIYFLIWLQINTSLILISFFYTVLAHINYKFTERSIDYLILLSTFINQSVFSCIDISLFPMFLIIFAAAFFTIIFRKFFSHIYLFILLAVLTVPYVHSFLEITDSHYALDFLLNTKFWCFAISLVLTPMFLLFFRVLIKFREGIKSNLKLAVFSLGYIFLIMTSFSIICLVRIPARNQALSKTQENRIIIASDENTIKVEVTERDIFDDLIRTVTIDTGKQVEICNVSIIGATTQPVLYSDYDSQATNSVTTAFSIPSNPPQHLSFSYGSTKEPGFIKVTTIYSKDNPEVYYLEESVVTIDRPGGKK